MLRSLGIVLYHLGLPLKDDSTVLEKLGGASHEAMRKSYLRCRDLFLLKKRKERTIAVDDTKIKIQGQWTYIRTAMVNCAAHPLIGIGDLRALYSEPRISHNMHIRSSWRRR